MYPNIYFLYVGKPSFFSVIRLHTSFLKIHTFYFFTDSIVLICRLEQSFTIFLI